jgi:phospholipid/cholesterol/gamma-HCH transport system substrate-binding protein
MKGRIAMSSGQGQLETWVGFGVVLVALTFGFFAYRTADVHFNQAGYRLYASFSKIDGLVRGAEVKVSGIKVGTVGDMTLDPKNYQAKVQLLVDQTLQLPTDSAVKIQSDGLLGGSHIQIEPGNEKEMLKADEEFEYTQGSVSLMDLIGHALFSATAEKKPTP